MRTRVRVLGGLSLNLDGAFRNKCSYSPKRSQPRSQYNRGNNARGPPSYRYSEKDLAVLVFDNYLLDIGIMDDLLDLFKQLVGRDLENMILCRSFSLSHMLPAPDLQTEAD